MPIVVGYWQLAEDEREFLEYVCATGTIVALPTHWCETKEELIPRPLIPFIERRDPRDLFFGLQKQLIWPDVVEPQNLDGGLRFAVPHMKSCVVAYGRGKLRDGRLALSNLSAYSEYPAEDTSSLVKKDPEFTRWVKRVTGWVRKFTSERLECNGYPYRATKRVREAASAGELQVVLY